MSTGNSSVNGTIKTDEIAKTYTQIKNLMETYHRLNSEANSITQSVKDNWVGEGKKEFEHQYNCLIRRIDDFGEMLTEIYNATVQADAAYQDADDEIRQKIVMDNTK